MSTNIKTWQERLPLCPTEAEMTHVMEVEIAELRAALAAALAAGQTVPNTAGTRMDASFVPLVDQAPSAPVAPDEQKVELMRSGLALMVELKKVKADHAKVLEDAYSALLWLHRRLPAAYKPLATVDQTIESIGRSIGYDARTDLAERAALSVKAEPAVTDEQIDRIAGCNGLYRAMTPDDTTCKSMVRRFTKDILAATKDAASPSAVEKMLETNELDELGEEVARLQRALCFWLPSVTDREDEVALRILEDAFLLVGIDGNIPDDFKSAQELGWVTLAAAPTPPTTGEA